MQTNSSTTSPRIGSSHHSTQGRLQSISGNGSARTNPGKLEEIQSDPFFSIGWLMKLFMVQVTVYSLLPRPTGTLKVSSRVVSYAAC